VIAHIGGVPIEEMFLPALLTGGALWTGLRVALSRRRLEQEDS
jgi:hypothetical protein